MKPTPDILQWLYKTAVARATGDKMLVGIYQGAWVEITNHGPGLDTYTIRQLPNGTPPAFYPPLSMPLSTPQQRIWYTAEINAQVLKSGLSCLFIYDPRSKN